MGLHNNEISELSPSNASKSQIDEEQWVIDSVSSHKPNNFVQKNNDQLGNQTKRPSRFGPKNSTVDD